MIYARLLPDQAVADRSQPHLADMARIGLRTLCLAQKDIPDKDYQVGPCKMYIVTLAEGLLNVCCYHVT